MFSISSSNSSSSDSNSNKQPAAQPATQQSQSSLSYTVTFNVGGTRYEVSRSLLEQHPNTMLARMASEEWQPAGDVGNYSCQGEFFIERNGSRFQYVLDFMRDGCVLLPWKSIAKDAIMMELLYFGFADVPPEAIQISCTAVESVDYLLSLDDEHKTRQSEHERLKADLKGQHEARMEELRRKQEAEKEDFERTSVELEHAEACMELAFHLFSRFKQDGRLEWVIYNGSADLYKWASAVHGSDDKQVFDEALGRYGLKYVQSWFMNCYPAPPVRIKIAKFHQ